MKVTTTKASSHLPLVVHLGWTQESLIGLVVLTLVFYCIKVSQLRVKFVSFLLICIIIMAWLRKQRLGSLFT